MTSDPPEDRNPEPQGGSGFNKTARRAARLITILAERWPLRSAGPLNLDDLSAIWWSGWDAGYRHGARGVNGDAIRARAIPAAVTAAGPAGTDLTEWQARVTDFAARITAMAMDGSDIARVIDGVAGSKRVSGTITAVAREESSTRAVATLQCKPSSWHPDGIEVAEPKGQTGQLVSRWRGGYRTSSVIEFSCGSKSSPTVTARSSGSSDTSKPSGTRDERGAQRVRDRVRPGDHGDRTTRAQGEAERQGCRRAMPGA